jgi:zinc transport system ATP-binding protein
LIAAALIDDPDVLLFDEPTVGVDIGGEESIFVMLTDLKKKRDITMLLITHDIHLVKEYTDKLLAMPAKLQSPRCKRKFTAKPFASTDKRSQDT